MTVTGLLALMLCASAGAAQQIRVVVRDAGPGPAAEMIRDALSQPYQAYVRDETRVVRSFLRDSVYESSIVVVGQGVAVASNVTGDVLVIGGDLFIRPGAEISGRAIAIGGGVYESTLANVAGGMHSFRDAVYTVTRVGDTIRVDYSDQRPPREQVTLPLAYGFRIPSYDRVNGLSVPWGPRVALARERFTIEPIVTYRSNLGALDPAVLATARVARRWSSEMMVGRFTRTNDAWIRGDELNSVAAFFLGRDARNYYRADVARADIRRLVRSPSAEVTFIAGAQYEDARAAVGGGTPWSAWGRRDTLNGMARPNPGVVPGEIASAIAGARARWDVGDVQMRLDLDAERPWRAVDDRTFTQLSATGQVNFPTFGAQSYSLFVRGVATADGPAPPQRFSYLGGSGTLITFDLLELGGDHLLYVENQYAIPLPAPQLPFVGAPVLTLRHQLGSAGVGGLPSLEQNIGVRVALSFLKVDVAHDPARDRTAVSAGLSFTR